MAFLDIEFPRKMKFHSAGGPRFSTNVNSGFGGQEQRNQNWSGSRAKYSVSLVTPASGVSSRRAYVDAVQALFNIAKGKANSFRLWDARDHSLAGQQIGTGNGSQTTFQLIKNYTIGSYTFARNITKPVMAPAVDYLGNALANSIVITPAPMSVDPATGIVTYAAAPGGGTPIIVTAGDFHVPVRFDTDELTLEVEESYVKGDQIIISVNGVSLVETFPPNY